MGRMDVVGKMLYLADIGLVKSRVAEYKWWFELLVWVVWFSLGSMDKVGADVGVFIGR